MRRFEVGRSYRMRSACDQNCVWEYKVIARTEKTVTLLSDLGEKILRRVSVWKDVEEVRPLGRYSMSPILRAVEI